MSDQWYVVRENRSGPSLCTTSNKPLVQPGYIQCKGPYATEAEAGKWIDDNCDGASLCSEDTCKQPD